MITVPELAAEALGSFLATSITRRFGSTNANLVEVIQSAAQLALDCIGKSDALYHNVEHTMLVTLVGYDILKGRSPLKSTPASDYAHFLVACLLHEIGYVRGVLIGDSEEGYIVDASGARVKLPRGSSDAALMPYHVDRSKLYVMDRIGQSKLLDAIRIARAIEFTRFPVTAEVSCEGNEECLLMRAASLIGQLGNPHYLQKANALYCEFEEVPRPSITAFGQYPLRPFLCFKARQRVTVIAACDFAEHKTKALPILKARRHVTQSAFIWLVAAN